MVKKVYVDGVLQEWGAGLFTFPVQSKKGKTINVLSIPKAINQARKKSTPNAIRQQLTATVKKTPEVMVKITGSGKNIKQIKGHFDYISRNGDVVLEDHNGHEIDGREAVRDLRDEWKDGKYVIPSELEEGTHRESFNIMLSMPEGSDRKAVKDAVRDFAKDEFAGKYDYVFAEHTDTTKPHVHLVVKARGYDGKRMNPRKADLQYWRETFAEKLREHGIEANATKRPARGVTQKPTKQKVHWAKVRGVADKYFKNENPVDPYAHKTAATRRKVVKSYEEVAKAMALSEDVEDRKVALKIVDLVKAMPAIEQAQSKSTEIDSLRYTSRENSPENGRE